MIIKFINDVLEVVDKFVDAVSIFTVKEIGYLLTFLVATFAAFFVAGHVVTYLFSLV